jgi:hypothetical protein
MVHSLMLAITTNGEHLTYNGFSLSETIRSGSLEFITDSFGSMSLSPKGSDSGTVFMGTTCSGSPSLCTILDDSVNEFYTTSSGEGNYGFPISWRRSMGTTTAPIATTPWPEDALTPHTMAKALLQTIVLWPDTRLPPERQ